MDDQFAFKLIVTVVSFATLACSGSLVWLTKRLVETSDEAGKAATEAARSIAISVERLEAATGKRRARGPI